MVVKDIGGFTLEFERKRIKRMHLHIRKDGSILLTAPMRASEKDILQFVTDESDWIKEHQEHILNVCEQRSHRYDSGATVPILGHQYILKISEGGRSRISLEGDILTMTVTEGTFEEREHLMNEFYRRLLKERLSELIPKWEEITDLHCSGWQTKIMTTRWGTCNTRTKKIWFSVRLGEKSDDLIEYVVLHELAHTLINNHGPDFKTLLTAYMPDWKERRKRLNSGSC